MKQIAIAFETLHDIMFILGTINNNHLLILPPTYDHVEYYCRKGFLFMFTTSSFRCGLQLFGRRFWMGEKDSWLDIISKLKTWEEDY